MKSLFRAAVLSLVTVSLAHGQCPGDVIPNGVVNGTDLAEVLGSWGSCSSCAADINGDSQVNAIDLAILLGGWGPCRPVINSISPAIGSSAGGALVTISGAYLAETHGVWFGNLPAQQLTLVSPTRVVAVAPAGDSGSVVGIRVTTPAGTASLDRSYEYVSIVVPDWATLIEPDPAPEVIFDSAWRDAIRASGYAWRIRHTQSQVEMVLIPPGTFDMGCTPSWLYPCASDQRESPVHTVFISQPFYIGRYEITQSQWTSIMGWNPSEFQGANYPDAPSHPVGGVNWTLAQQYLSATGLRLPTEAEWEYAYRAGTRAAFHGTQSVPQGFDDDEQLGVIAWFGPTANGQTRPVGQKLANGFGLHDMSGNVWEWVSDRFDWSYYSASPAVDPTGPAEGAMRVLRGGGWHVAAGDCRASKRHGDFPIYGYNFTGFRVARNP